MADTMITTAAHRYIEEIFRLKRGSLWSRDEQLHALEQAAAAPIPSPTEEDWRRTDPDAFPWGNVDEVQFESTRRALEVSSLGDRQASVGLSEPTDLMRDLMAISGDDYDARFLYLHKALHHTPACVTVPKDSRGGGLSLRQAASGPGIGTFGTLIVVESGAELTIYDRWHAGDARAALIGRAEILLRPGAHLTYVQEDHLPAAASIYRRARVQLEDNARLDWVGVTTGCRWHAARMEVLMSGTNTDARVGGLYLGSGSSHADHRTHQFHTAPGAHSDLIFKTLLAGRARSIYQGMITVPQQAQQTDAYQKCRNLMLDPGTHADAIPRLEIVADDVKCSHGATIGSLNPEQLFYLQSRGLNRRQALTAIASGFAEEIIQRVPEESIREAWRELVSSTIGRSGSADA